MKKRSIQLSIPQPCTQSWNDMAPSENGRHCAHCNKCVTDFTGKSDEEIYRIVKKSRGNICGRFNNAQLNRPVVSYENSSLDLLKVAAMAAGVTFFSLELKAQEQGSDFKTELNKGLRIEPAKLVPHDNSKLRILKIIGEVQGKVEDSTGNGLPFAEVVLMRGDNRITSCHSDTNGFYEIRMETIKADKYILRASYAGYPTKEVIMVSGFPEDRITFINFKMGVTNAEEKSYEGPYQMGSIAAKATCRSLPDITTINSWGRNLFVPVSITSTMLKPPFRAYGIRK